MTIEEDVRKLAELRRKKAEIDEEIKVSREGRGNPCQRSPGSTSWTALKPTG